MQIFPSDCFAYKDQKLFCEEVSLSSLAEEFGTPFYAYSKKFMRDRYNEFTSAFEKVPQQIFYAAKANFNLSVIKTFVSLGAGADVNSEGELFRALKTGVRSDKIILTGVGKTEREIIAGIENKVLMIKAESEEELHLINKLAASYKIKAPVALRINPDVDPKTHPYISTGLSENKFGIETARALDLYKNYSSFSNIEFTGIDMHIGSQITADEPFIEAVEKMSGLFFQIKSYGVNLHHFDVGGGFGVQYNGDYNFSISNLAAKLVPIFQKLNCKIFFEPGRFLTANGGALVAKVLFTKKNGEKNFIIIDAAMNDLLRPSIYGAHHHIQKVETDETEMIEADIVGPVCESGDFIAKNRIIHGCRQNDLLAVMSAGAYGMVMSSNYNARRRAAEILVDGKNYKLIRSRENYEHLLYDEESLMD